MSARPRAVVSWRPVLGALALAAAVVAAVDLSLSAMSRPSVPVLGVLDEAGHLATAALLLGAALVAWPGRLGLSDHPRPDARLFLVGVLLGAVAIDVDHIPLLLGSGAISAGSPRPYSHSLPTLIVATGLGALPTRARLLFLGAAAGVAAHLVRDMATGGVPLLWPLSASVVTIPYGLYLALLGAGALATGAALARVRRSRLAPAAPSS